MKILSFASQGLVLFMLFGLHCSVWGQDETYQAQMQGTSAPSFEATDLAGNVYKLSELKGEYVVVLNFWFMTCSACLHELDELNRVQARFQEEKVLFLAITIDEDEELLKVFLRRYPFAYQVVSKGRDIAKAYQVSLYPTNLVIDQGGKIIFAKRAFHSDIDEQLAKAIQEALR